MVKAKSGSRKQWEAIKIIIKQSIAANRFVAHFRPVQLGIISAAVPLSGTSHARLVVG